jgi:uncharacterized protein DUF4154
MEARRKAGIVQRVAGGRLPSKRGLPAQVSQPALTLCRLFFILSAVLVFVPRTNAQRLTATEYQVKAAYLYNFGKFVGWPDKGALSKDEPFEICVLGEDPFGLTLDSALTGAKISGKIVTAKRISKPQEIDSCRILFISSSEGAHLEEILGTLERASVLTVSDIPQFSQRGGMIEFVLDGGRVRFQVNLTNAEGAGLNMSSELLKVAVRVMRNPRPGN